MRFIVMPIIRLFGFWLRLSAAAIAGVCSLFWTFSRIEAEKSFDLVFEKKFEEIHILIPVVAVVFVLQVINTVLFLLTR